VFKVIWERSASLPKARKYDGSMCAVAAMLPIAIITAATCYHSWLIYRWTVPEKRYIALDSVILASIRHDIVGVFRTSSDTVDAECLPRVVSAVV